MTLSSGVYQGTNKANISNFSPTERERLVEPYLPEPDSEYSRSKATSNSFRNFLRTSFYSLVYLAIYFLFDITMRCRQAYNAIIDRVLAIIYHHHRTLELIRKDVRNLRQLPRHLSAILTIRRGDDALDILINEVAELTAWCFCTGIPILSIYEKTGVLKSYMPNLHEIIVRKITCYCGSESKQPELKICAPNHPSYPMSHSIDASALNLFLLSHSDGRDTFVNLSKTLSELAQDDKLSPRDISIKLIDAEINEVASTDSLPSHDPKNPSRILKSEPDLLLIFGPHVELDGYPPWQIRLTEIYCTGDKGVTTRKGAEVEYQRFLDGLWRFSMAEMRFGK